MAKLRKILHSSSGFEKFRNPSYIWQKDIQLFVGNFEFADDELSRSAGKLGRVWREQANKD